MSEATTEATTNAEATASSETAQTDTSSADTVAEKDWQAEAEKWKAFSRKHEEAAKANADKAKRLDEFEESQKTELQKAADAAAAAKADADASKAQTAVLQAMVDHGLSKDDLELLGSHGTPEEIDQRAERLATRLKGAQADKPKPDFGGGDRGKDVTSKGAQLSEADVKRLMAEGKHQEVNKAREEGRLNDLLGIK